MNKYAQEKETELPIAQNVMLKILQEIITKKEERLLIPGMVKLRVDMIVIASILSNLS